MTATLSAVPPAGRRGADASDAVARAVRRPGPVDPGRGRRAAARRPGRRTGADRDRAVPRVRSTASSATSGAAYDAVGRRGRAGPELDWLNRHTWAVPGDPSAAGSDCDLCEAARITPLVPRGRHLLDRRVRDLRSPDGGLAQARDRAARRRSRAHARPARPASSPSSFDFEHYVDDNMRNIPDHYHAHARPKGGFFGHGLKRTTSETYAEVSRFRRRRTGRVGTPGLPEPPPVEGPACLNRPRLPKL